MKQLGIPLVWILLSGSLIAPIASLPAFAVDTTSTDIVSSQNPSSLDQSVTFTATVTPLNATGIVEFTDTSITPNVILGTSVISGGHATFSTSSLSIGTHDIVAIYDGDANNSPSASAALVQTVNKIGTTTTVTSSLNPSTFGQSVNFTATVAPVSGSLVPIGTIQFLVDGAVTGGPVTLTGGHATSVISSLSVGTHSISATYSGNTIFAASTGALNQTTHQIGTSVVVVSSQNPSVFGQLITLKATVLPSSATGIVQFNDTSVPSTILGSSTISGGIAEFSISSLSVGNHNIVARYLGDINNIPSTSNLLTQIINPVSASTTTLSANTTSIIFGHSITFTAIVLPSNVTGTVQFKVNGTHLGAPITLLGGKAIFSTSSLHLGSDIVTASYSGDTNFNSSSSNSVTITVASASQGATVEKVDGKIKLGKGENFKFDINSKNGTKFNGHLNYHDKTAHFVLHSTQITSLSVDSSMTHIAFMGQAKITGNPHDNNSTDQLTFSVNITDSDKKGDHIQFSIIVTDSSSKVVYQKSGTAKGHIEIHKVNPDLLDSNTHPQDNDTQNRNSENDDTENSNSHSQNFDSHSQNSNSHSKNGSSHSKNNNQHSD